MLCQEVRSQGEVNATEGVGVSVCWGGDGCCDYCFIDTASLYNDIKFWCMVFKI